MNRIQSLDGRLETVRLKLVNRGSLSHNIHIEGAPINTETVQGGSSDTVEFTPSEDGSIRFFCNVPGHAGSAVSARVAVHGQWFGRQQSRTARWLRQR